MEQAPGRTLLKVTGIIYIVLAAVNIFGAIMGMIGGGLIGSAGGGEDVLMGASLIVLALVVLVQGILGLVMGIMGVKHCNNPAKAGGCFVLGIIVLALGAFSLVSNIIGKADVTTIGSAIAGMVIPGLYTYGAYLNKKAA